MQHHVLKRGIAIMAVRMPAAGTQINLHVARANGSVANSHHGAAEIRAGLIIFETRMKDSHHLAVQSLELIAQQPLLLPDRLGAIAPAEVRHRPRSKRRRIFHSCAGPENLRKM